MKETMDDEEVELSSNALFPISDSSSSIQASLSSDLFLDGLLRNAQTCTHTHTCNPPGPDAAHTHTCYHTHTHVIPSKEETTEKSPVSKPQRASGNKEAVRKYREKKKAHAAFLEEEVKKLRSVNQDLIRKLQRQAILEAEVSRLRNLLVDLKGKINDELGDFPFQKQCSECVVPPVNGLVCGVSGTSVPSGVNGCGDPMATWDNNCQCTTAVCQTNLNYVENSDKCAQVPEGDHGTIIRTSGVRL